MNAQQKTAIINFMESNYKNLYGKHSSLKGPASKEKKWKELVENLNLLGPPSKNKALWQRCWIDIKSKLKTKVSNSKQELQKTGGGPQTIILTEEDIKLINIIKEENISGLNINESRVRNIQNITSIENLNKVPADDEITVTDNFESTPRNDIMESHTIEAPERNNVNISNEARDFLRQSSSLTVNPSSSKNTKSFTPKVNNFLLYTTKQMKCNFFYV